MFSLTKKKKKQKELHEIWVLEKVFFALIKNKNWIKKKISKPKKILNCMIFEFLKESFFAIIKNKNKIF